MMGESSLKMTDSPFLNLFKKTGAWPLQSNLWLSFALASHHYWAIYWWSRGPYMNHTHEPAYDKIYNNTCVTSKVSHQPKHPHSIATGIVYISLDSPKAVEGMWDQQRLWSECKDVQADLSLHWSHVLSSCAGSCSLFGAALELKVRFRSGETSLYHKKLFFFCLPLQGGCSLEVLYMSVIATVQLYPITVFHIFSFFQCLGKAVLHD